MRGGDASPHMMGNKKADNRGWFEINSNKILEDSQSLRCLSDAVQLTRPCTVSTLHPVHYTVYKISTAGSLT